MHVVCVIPYNNRHEKHQAFQLLGDGLELLHQRPVDSRHHQNHRWLSHVHHIRQSLGQAHERWHAGLDQPRDEHSLLRRARVGQNDVVEVAENHDAGFGETVVSSDCVTSVEELEHISHGGVLSDGRVRGVELALEGTDVDDCLLDGQLLDGKLVTGELLRRGTGLLLDPSDDRLLVAAASVVGLLARAADG